MNEYQVVRTRVEDDVETINIPEFGLFLAIIDRAIRDVKNTDMHEIEQHVSREARIWLNSRSDKVFSFRWMCQQMDLNPRTVMRLIDEEVVYIRPHHRTAAVSKDRDSLLTSQQPCPPELQPA